MNRHPPSIAGSHEFVAEEIARFRKNLELYQAGRIPDAVFLEQRLRHGVYGQRQDGVYMMRSKLALGVLDADGLDAFADIAERFGNGNAHLTTRQDIQTHFVDINQTPDLMRVLDAVNQTSREACGNVVRNITASPLAGVEVGEAFDVTPYGMALARFLLRHPDGQSMGRKFKITLAGTDDPQYNLAALHDVGLTARVRDGVRGFRVVVGGGLGPVPHEAELYDEFVPADQVHALLQAILKVFARHGEKKNRARARMKFLVAKLGLEGFRALVEAARAELPASPAHTEHLRDGTLTAYDPVPLFPPSEEELPYGRSDADDRWLRSNVILQKQPGYATVRVRVPRGDLAPDQLRGVARLLREHTGDNLRIGLDQSLFIRFVPFDRLLPLRQGLSLLGLGMARAGVLGDTVTCPGADTCKLGITSPRALARTIQTTLDRLAEDPRLANIRIHVSGCPNSCAQHQIADIGLFGATRSVSGHASPHYMLVLGGRAGGAPRPELVKLGELGSGFGNMVTKIPAHRVAEAIELLCELYLAEAGEGEEYGAFWRRIGFPRIKQLIKPLQELPKPEAAPWFFREPGSEERFRVVRGQGECAGAAVLGFDLLLADAEAAAEEATEILEGSGPAEQVTVQARVAMQYAARALLAYDGLEIEEPDAVARAFQERFYDSGRIFEGVGYYFLDADARGNTSVSGDRLRRLVVESGLFVAEAQSILAKLGGAA